MTSWFWKYGEASLILLGLFLVYRLFLRRSTHFRWNRIYLIAGMVLSVLMPFLPRWGGTSSSRIVWELNEVLVYQEKGQGVSVDSYSTMDILTTIYWLGVAAAGLLVATGLVRLMWVTIRSRKEPGNVIRTPQGTGIFSWFHLTFIPVDEDPSKQVLAHERAHIQFGHSYDNAFAQLFCIVFWFHPVSWYFRRELGLIHEYQADRFANKSISDWQSYAQEVVAYAMKTDPLVIGQSFARRSELGKRLEMLRQSNGNNSRSVVRFASIILLVPACMFARGYTNPAQLNVGEHQDALSADKVDDMPQYPGGMNELYTFIGSNLKYPAEMLDSELEGKVHVGFTVDWRGRVVDAHIAKGLHPAFDKAALETIKRMPDWKPGMSGGKTVNVRLVLPVMFKTN